MRGLKIAAVSLGCAKNRIDTEEILGLLERRGCIITGDPAEADAIIINTCAFIEEAQEESIDTILELAGIARARKALLIAAGCLAQRFGGRLLEEIPELSGVAGVHSYAELPALLESCFAGRRELLLLPPPHRYRSPGPRLLTGSPHSAYVKIAEGCSNRCRYCLIPSLRGPLRSRPAGEIINEIRRLVEGGAREINLMAQDTTAYGADRGAADGLSDLIRRILQDIPAFFWLRILYAHPSRVSDSLIDLLAGEKRICKYLDLPLQHVNTQLLQSMGRGYSREDILALVRKLRQRIPGVTLRTTYLVGYPGETPARFRELCSFLEQEPFERVGVFAYSCQPGTAAAALEGQVPRRVALKRRRRLLQIQQKIALSLNRELMGKTCTVLVEELPRRGGALYRGRASSQAPEVDGLVYFRSPCPLRRGDLVNVRVAAVSPYDLLGKALGCAEEPAT